MGERGTEFTSVQRFLHSEGEDRQWVIVTDYITGFGVENIGDCGGPWNTFPYQLEIRILCDVCRIIPVHKIMAERREIASGCDGKHEEAKL